MGDEWSKQRLTPSLWMKVQTVHSHQGRITIFDSIHDWIPLIFQDVSFFSLFGTGHHQVLSNLFLSADAHPVQYIFELKLTWDLTLANTNYTQSDPESLCQYLRLLWRSIILLQMLVFSLYLALLGLGFGSRLIILKSTRITSDHRLYK